MKQQIDPSQAVDLEKAREAQQTIKAEAEQSAEQAKAAEDFKRFDRAMTRTFKGIYPRPLRIAVLKRKIREAEELGLLDDA